MPIAIVTGSGGLIGSESVVHFAERGYTVVGLENDMRARVFARHAGEIEVVIHTAAQPSHDWAAQEPQTDFGVNANGTLNLLEAARAHCPDAPFVHCSTNKVYGDTPNRLPLQNVEKR